MRYLTKPGNGALHATVIYAKRGEMLRMEGPLGLSGQALTLVCTYTLKPSGSDGTQLTLNVNGAGEYSPETPEMVRQVWEHFLWERFKPYIEAHHASQIVELLHEKATLFSRNFPEESAPLIRISYSPFRSDVRNEIFCL